MSNQKQKPFRAPVLEKIKMKKFLLPFQNMVRADLFSGSLAVWNALGFRIPFELIQEYTASWEKANLKRPARGARRAACIEFERAFWAKRKRIYQ